MRLTVGRIGRAHGVRGAVLVGVRTDEPELRFAAGSKLDTDPAAVGPLTVAATRWRGGELIVRFAGVRDRDAAEALRGTWLSVDSSALEPPEDPDEFRDHDLIGLTVRTVSGASGPGGPATGSPSAGHTVAGHTVAGSPAAARAEAGRTVGEVVDVLHHGQDLLVVRPASETAAPDILIPFVKAIVPEVDLAQGVLLIDPPEGLLDPSAP